MLPYFTEFYGNASSVYGFAGNSKEAMANARETIAASLGAKANEIYFTAGGSEADNWALKATAEAYKAKGNHIITTKIEHHAIPHTAEYLEKNGFEVRVFHKAMGLSFLLQRYEKISTLATRQQCFILEALYPLIPPP